MYGSIVGIGAFIERDAHKVLLSAATVIVYNVHFLFRDALFAAIHRNP